MKIILVRHGQTQDNVDDIIQKATTPINELGRRQAKILAEKLKDEKIDVIYTSDLQRALETTEEIIKFHPRAKVIRTPALREKDAGIFKGRRLEEHKNARIASGKTFYEFVPEGGESMIELQNRVVTFYKELIHAHKDEIVLLVAHHGTIKCLLLYLLGKSFDEWTALEVENTALTVIEVNDKKLHTIRALNSVDHLIENFDRARCRHACTQKSCACGAKDLQ